MNLRAFLAGTGVAVLAAPLAAEGQPAGKPSRIAYLGGTPFTSGDRVWDAFVQGLRQLGWVEGQNIVIEQRFTGGRPERFPELIAEVLRIPVDVIVVADSQAAWAAKRATSTTPIVLANVADAVGQGLASSLARPGGNVTGLSNQLEDTAGKRLQVLREIIPSLSRLAVVFNPNNPASHTRIDEALAAQVGIKIIPVPFRAPADLDPAFATITRERAEALILHIASPIVDHWPQFIEFAQKQRIPTAGQSRRFVQLGGLVYFGTDSAHLFGRAASYVDRILKGTKPADLPIEQPTKFELVINLKTAKALGLTIPQSLLLRADEVIQ
jgi:putative ABC transport system substrate-binding protein